MRYTREYVAFQTLVVLWSLSTAGSGWAQCDSVEMTASDALHHASFGYAIAVEGDVAVVGAPHHRPVPGGGRTGAAYVFERQGIAWEEVDLLSASDGVVDDWFGRVVAMSGDTVLVGAPFKNDVGFLSGSAYVFERAGSGWGETKLVPSDAQSQIFFGQAVAVSDDLAVVGAPGDFSMPAVVPGAAYVFERTAAGWQETAKLEASDVVVSGRFGISVAIDGDRIVVGAPFNQGFLGGVYVFERVGSTWTEVAVLTASDGVLQDAFGYSVDVEGDTIVATAPYHGEWQVHLDTDAGAGYVFERASSGLWTEVSELVGYGDYFDREMGMSASLEGGTIVLGSQDVFWPAGAWVFEREPDGTWPPAQVDLLGRDNGGGLYLFGRPAVISGRTVVVGEVDNSTAGTEAGAAYFFELDALGSSYCCPAVLNSTGEWGRIRALGSTKVIDDELTLSAGYLPPANVGYFLASDGDSPIHPPGAAGSFCLAGGTRVRRLLPPILNTDQHDGGFEISIGTHSVPGLGAITPGRTWNFQAWYRDNAAGTSNFTDAVSVTFD